MLETILMSMTALQDAVLVPATNGTSVSVPTIAQASENFLYASSAIIISILTIVAWAIKNGLLDSILSKRQKQAILNGAEGTIVGLKKALEDKAMIRYSLELMYEKATTEEDRNKILPKIQNITKQIEYTQKQIDYYTGKLKINPDDNSALPREDFNIATETLVRERTEGVPR